MLRDAAIELLKARISRRATDPTLEPLILAEMQAAQDRLEGDAFLPWFLVSNDSTASTVVDRDYVSVPTSFLREYDDDALYIVNDDGSRSIIKKTDRETLGTESGKPRYYALVGEYFFFSPIPDAEYTLRMVHYKKATVLDTNIENAWLKHGAELLIAETGKVIASKYVKNDALAQEFLNDIVAARTRLMSFSQARQDANREYVAED